MLKLLSFAFRPNHGKSRISMSKPGFSKSFLSRFTALFSSSGSQQLSSTSKDHSKMSKLDSLNFDNLVLRSLPVDLSKVNQPRQVRGSCFALVDPTPVENPQTVAVSLPALDLLDIGESEVENEDFAQYFSGSRILKGSETAAHCYCGHQFGSFAGQLGDGAAIYLGEIVNQKGERWEIQLKGAGLTPFSRMADGRKVLRSTIREFLCSEAMHHLGIPTTCAGSCITSDSTVVRDIFYNGNPIQEKCTVVLRIAPTFIRFGSFQICKPPDRETGRDGPSVGRIDILDQLTEYVTKTFYPKIWERHSADKKEACVELFRQVVHRTAGLVAQWQCVGWCHGVLNTDNMSIVGATIDYGPYGFMDRYDPTYICNASDNGGRYAYNQQPEICKWNCSKLADALAQMSYMDMTCLYPVLEEYQGVFDKEYMSQMRKKFGLTKELAEDQELADSFLNTMEQTGADFTNSFRCLSRLSLPGSDDYDSSKSAVLDKLVEQCCTLEELIRSYRPTMDPRQLQMFLMLLEMNPELLAQLGAGRVALQAEMTRLEKVKALKEKKPEDKMTDDREAWQKWLERYTARLRADLDGISTELTESNQNRRLTMNSVNPRFILRNYIAQRAIESAEKGDYSEVRRVLKLLQSPFSEDTDEADLHPLVTAQAEKDEGEQEGSAASACPRPGFAARTYDSRAPDWATDLRVT